MIKIATWNLDYRNTVEIREHMNSRPADVWILTETQPNISPGDEYERKACSPPHGLNNRYPDGCFVAVWVRRACLDAGWTVTNEKVLPAHESRMACIRIVQRGERDVVVVGTVLPWLSDPQWSGTVGFCAALAAQAAEWRHHWGNQSAGFCVAGDFNQALPCMDQFGTTGGATALAQILGALQLRCLTGFENDPRPHLANKPSIDHLCVSTHLLQVGSVDCWCEERDLNGPNGHAGVLAELRVL